MIYSWFSCSCLFCTAYRPASIGICNLQRRIARLDIGRGGNIRHQLKTPYRDGTTHVIFEPLDFMVRLAALIPRPRANLTRFHGVFAPNSKHRALITPAKRGKGNKRQENSKTDDCTPANRHVAMTCTQGHKGTALEAGVQH
jgi:hypothetical protein